MGDPETEIVLTVSTVDGALEVAVSNRGRGIDPAELARIFERFRRSREARQSPDEGIGLGLYIARGLVEAHGGRIWAESTPGETVAPRSLIEQLGGIVLRDGLRLHEHAQEADGAAQPR